VSADRRFVELRLSYRTAQLNGAVQAVPVKVGAVDAVNELLAAPPIDIQAIESMLTIPAGKTVLLAGPVMTREERTESGTPVLSKIPYVSRLYTNVGHGRAQYRHMLLVTARVLSPTPPSECCVASPTCKTSACDTPTDCKACPAADCKACPATCEKVAVAKPARPAETEVTRLVAAYRRACADGNTEAAMRLAMQALSRDPNCFAEQK
jgi:hypothetical protein